MAYVPRQLPEDQENQFGRTDATTPEPAPAGGGSAGSGGGEAPGVGSSTQFGSNAAKLSDYLKANQGQVADFGQQVAGKLTGEYDATRGAIDQGFNTFNQDVQGGYTPPDPTRFNTAVTDPAAFVKDQKNVQDFQNWYNPTYGGPQDFESSNVYSNLNNQVNRAVENAGLVNDEAGLGTFLNNFMNNGTQTTQGMRALDTALLRKSPEASQTIRNAAAPYKNLSTYLGETAQKANKSIQDTKQAAAQSGENVRNAFLGPQGAVPTFQKDIEDRTKQLQETSTQRAKRVRDLLGGPSDIFADQAEIDRLVSEGVIAPDYGSNIFTQGEFDKALADLGLTPEDWQSIKGKQNIAAQGYGTEIPGMNINFLDYLTQQNPDAANRLSTVGTVDDYARAAALAQLTGQPLSFGLNEPNLAGTGTEDLSDFNLSGVNAVLDPIVKSIQDIQKPVGPTFGEGGGGTPPPVVQPGEPTPTDTGGPFANWPQYKLADDGKTWLQLRRGADGQLLYTPADTLTGAVGFGSTKNPGIL